MQCAKFQLITINSYDRSYTNSIYRICNRGFDCKVSVSREREREERTSEHQQFIEKLFWIFTIKNRSETVFINSTSVTQLLEDRFNITYIQFSFSINIIYNI